MPKPAGALRRLRLLVDGGARRYPRVVRLVVNARSTLAARRIADRVGRRFYGAKYLGVFVVG
jgi:hypothetical protein